MLEDDMVLLFFTTVDIKDDQYWYCPGMDIQDVRWCWGCVDCPGVKINGPWWFKGDVYCYWLDIKDVR